MKVALVYDRVNKIGGAERILAVLHELYPDAPLFTLVYDAARAPWAKDWDVRTSFLQFLPFARTYHEFFPVLPIFAFETFDFSAFDVVISVTSGEAKGIITGPDTLHICYLLTPTRYLWSHYETYFENKWLKLLSAPIVSYLRLWDQMAVQRPDVLVAISRTVAERIRKYYKRETEVIYPPATLRVARRAGPPVDVISDKKEAISNKNLSHIASRLSHNYFLVVSRLVIYKRVDLAIAACNKLKLPLKIVGTGMEEGRLRKIAGPTIEFLGNLTDGELSDYYRNCRALLFPQEEDFGMVAVEALSCGVPVIAYAAGGAKEIVIGGKNGELFSPQAKEGLIKVLEKFTENAYSRDFCRRSVLWFDREVFKKRFASLVREKCRQFGNCLKIDSSDVKQLHKSM